jgi:excisionase family DNA binding protein
MENLTEGLTLETLPKAFTHLTNEVSEIKRLLLEKSNEQPTETDRWFDLKELCIYHPDKPSKPTVYGWVNAGTIPVHKGGKKLRFLKSEIDNWLLQGRKKTLAEIASEAKAYLSNNKKGLNNGK